MPQGIPVVVNPSLFAIRIIIVMEEGVFQHVRQSILGYEGMLKYYADETFESFSFDHTAWKHISWNM